MRPNNFGLPNKKLRNNQTLPRVPVPPLGDRVLSFLVQVITFLLGGFTALFLLLFWLAGK